MVALGRCKQRRTSQARRLLAIGDRGYGAAFVMTMVGQRGLILGLILPVVLGRRKGESGHCGGTEIDDGAMYR